MMANSTSWSPWRCHSSHRHARHHVLGVWIGCADVRGHALCAILGVLPSFTWPTLVWALSDEQRCGSHGAEEGQDPRRVGPPEGFTLTKLYVILGISMFLGVASFGFWVTNSGFLPTTNDALMFINLACGPEYANIPQHTIYDNDTLCQPAGIALLADVRRPRLRAPLWTDFHDQAQEFTILS